MPMFPYQPPQAMDYDPYGFNNAGMPSAPSQMQAPMQQPMPMAPQMPMGMPQMPQQQAAPQLPKIPKPGQLPVRGGMAQPSTNSTGGPSQGANSALRSGVFTQLYRLGKQMDGKSNMFGQYDPNALPTDDPLAWMNPAPEPDPRVMPQLPPSPQGPSPAQYMPQGPMPPRPIDRFPRAAAMMGRPLMPQMQGQGY